MNVTQAEAAEQIVKAGLAEAGLLGVQTDPDVVAAYRRTLIDPLLKDATAGEMMQTQKTLAVLGVLLVSDTEVDLVAVDHVTNMTMAVMTHPKFIAAMEDILDVPG